MKRFFCALLGFAVILVLCCSAAAEDFDPTVYSYEELLQIREKIDLRLEELDRQYAIEHANRAISFMQPVQVVYIGSTVRIIPSVTNLDDTAPEQTTLVWSSSDPDVADVSGNGTVTAVSQGEAVITASAEDNIYLCASYTVQAAIPAEKITVWGPEGSLVLGAAPEDAEATLGFSIEPEDAYYQEVSWVSSDETVAAVDELGTVRALQPGTAVITAILQEEPQDGRDTTQGTYEITVEQAATALEIAEQTLRMNAGDTAEISVSVAPEDASNPGVVFTSSNPEIAAVDEHGTVTALACGEAEILCEAADGYGAAASCHVIVTRMVTGLTLSEETISMAVGETRKVEAVIEPEDATRKETIWTSSNVFVARVAAGTIEAVGQGDCVITCTTTDGSDLNANLTVHVPTFSVDSDAYSVTEKTGLRIQIARSRKDCTVEMRSDSPCFSAEMEEDSVIFIDPVAAGEGVIELSNPDAPEDTIYILITVENSAVFNQESYPPIDYTEAVRAPEQYEGLPVSAYGRVLQVNEDRYDGTRTFILGTAGANYTDQTLWIVCDASMYPEALAEDDMVTVYGTFRMEHIFSEILEAETQLPAMEAEKITLPQKPAEEEGAEGAE